MKVRDIMARDVQVFEPTAHIYEIAKVMRDMNIGSVPIVQDGNLVGVITDRDITVRVVAAGLDPRAETAETHMSISPVTASPDWSIEQAAEVMAAEQIRRLPVVENDQLVGYLAIGDIAMQNKDRKVGDALEQISEPLR